CATLPPIDRRRAAVDKGRGQLDRPDVAELPQFLGSPRVLEENLVDLEGVQLARPETVEGLTGPFYEFDQLGLVVGSDGLACGSPLRLARHAPRLPRLDRHQPKRQGAPNLVANRGSWVHLAAHHRGLLAALLEPFRDDPYRSGCLHRGL